MKKHITKILLIFLIVLGISGCGNSSGSAAEIILVTDTGGVNDKSFNQGTWEGVQKISSELGIKSEYIESKSEADLVGNLKKAAEKANIVVCAGFLFEGPVSEVAPQYPDDKFIIIDGQPKDENDNPIEIANVYSYFFNELEAGYLVGYIAGKTTQTNKVGFIGGLEIPAVQNFGWGYVQGVQKANPNASVEYIYTNSFTDVTKGKQTALSMNASGVDIIFTAAGAVNTGAVEAAKEIVASGKNLEIIGVDRDMYDDGIYIDANGTEKSVVLTSAMKKTGNAAYEAIKAIKNGETMQAVTTFNVASGNVGMPDNNPNIKDQTVINEANEALQSALANNELKLNANDIAQILTITINGKY